MKTIRVSAAIIREGDRILAAQRGYGEFKGGWEFPGGKIEAGETSAEACVREIREELGVRIDGLRLLCTVEHDYDTFHLSMDCFVCSIADGAINDTEHNNLAWLDATQLWDVSWLPADTRVVREIERELCS